MSVKREGQFVVYRDYDGIERRIPYRLYKTFQRAEHETEKYRSSVLKKLAPYTSRDAQASGQTIEFVPYRRVDIKGFKTQKAIEQHIALRTTHAKPSYFKQKAEIYRENMAKSVAKTFNRGDAARLMKEIRSLTPEQLQFLLLQHPQKFSIGYIYFDTTDSEAEKLKTMMYYIKLAKETDLEV